MSKNMPSAPEEGKWAPLAYRLAISTICHPLEYGKTLIQLGHEPIAPYPTKTLFGRPAKGLPGIFEYVRHIKRVDGLSGCYKGVGLRICALSVGSIAQSLTLEKLQKSDAEYNETSTNENSVVVETSQWRKFKKTVGYEMTARIVGTVASQPLNVCVVRCMAQFVGREAKYNDVISCIREIYNEEGILGFFSGLAPRLLAEICHILIVAALSHFVNNYLLKEEDPYNITGTSVNSPAIYRKRTDKLKMVSEASSLAGQFIASTLTYPLLVVSNCMIVNDCGLAAGLPPNSSIYSTWRDCFWDLYSKNQLKRGSSLLWRYAT